jgi:ATP phosphoribosyltransferase regulatory subunit
MPGLKVTVDPVENRGFEYHTGISFAFFARLGRDGGPLGELGRGGRYNAGNPTAPEPATGVTLYTDIILSTLPAASPRHRVLLPPDVDKARAAALREEGWVTIAALSKATDWHGEALRLACGFVLENGAPAPVRGGRN